MKKKSIKSNNAKSKDIISLILRDHKPLKKLILILKDSKIGIEKKQPAFADFEKELICHAKAEEESLYIHLKQEDNLRMEGIEGDIEHNIAEQLIKEVNGNRGDDDDKWMANVKVLAEIVDHHLKEEEKDVLNQVKKEFSYDERIEMGEIYSRLLNKYHEEENFVPKIYASTKNEMLAAYA